MSWSLRRVLVVLTAVAILGSAACLQTAFAQKQQPGLNQVIIQPINPISPNPNGAADAASFDLPKDTAARRRIEAARDYIDAKRWPEVVQALQDILDDPQDKFAPLARKGPDGKEVEVPTSVRAEANRLLSGLPKEGLEVYRASGATGPKAAEYLKKAKEATTTEDRVAELGLVVRNYLHTDAGGEAADLLATHYMDRGDFRTAARFYNLLLTRAGSADDLPPDTLFRAAYAFNQAGDKTGEDFIWQTAHSRGIREIKFGDDTKSIDDLQNYLASIGPAPEAVGRQWAYFLGDAGHTAKGDGGPAFMYRKWETPTTTGFGGQEHLDSGVQLDALFKRAAEPLTRLNQPVLPPQFPVTATVTMKNDGKKHSLVVFRTHAGITACDMTGGKRVGAAPIKGSLDWWMSDNNHQMTFNQWTQAYIDQNQRPGIFFENTNIGALSTDGDFAYTIEDLAIPPPPQFRMMGFPGQPQNPWNWPADVVDMVSHSRLVAYDLSSGCKTAWEAGGADKPNEKSELTDSYFLGPPMAVNGKLYVLAEKQQEMRLICLENIKGDTAGTWKPKVDFVLPLGVARDSKIQMDVLRRVNAAHLSYGEGVLVCPTNLGYVIGIDLLQNSLLWAYPYRDQGDVAAVANPNPGLARVIGPGVIIGPNGLPIPQSPPQQGWKTSAPMIQDGKVVFTAPDSKSVHCINLKDGTPAWANPKPRQEGDLYLGAVVNGKVIVVGSRVVRAYNLSNGEEAWKVEAGLPSGFGAASDNVYYVPLKEAVGSKEPEICAIDVDRGVVIGHSKAHPEKTGEKVEVPGNLVFFDGGIVSQTNDEVIAYPQVKVKIAEMTEKLKANPNDADGLFGRGELSLEEGNLENAVEDFRAVLKNSPAGELSTKAKAKLYDALTAYFQHDFDRAEKYQEDYAALCSLDLPPTATEQEKADAPRRRTNYLYLIAKGKEGQRRLTDAFDLYMQLNAESKPDELLSLVDERLVKAAPDVLAQGRIAAMVAGATEEERKPLEARIAARWKEIQSKNDLAELRKFVSLFGSLFTVGQEARLQLAEQLMSDDKDENSLIDAERQLSLLRARTQDPGLAARAVECLARLNTRKGLLEDAAYYYRQLRDHYADVKVKDGKTGADLFNEMATDKRLWSNLDEPPRFGAAGTLKPSDEHDNFNQQIQSYKFSHEGEPLPFFQRYKLSLLFGANHELKLVDRTTGEPRWDKDKPVIITKTMFQTFASGNTNPQFVNPGFVAFPGQPGFTTQPTPAPKFSFTTLGHLIVLPVGHVVVGIDAISGRRLWEKNLFDPAGGPASQPAMVGQVPGQGPTVTVDPRDGSALVAYSDGWTQRLGQTSPLEGAAVCLQMKDALTAIDPISGRVLWTRSDVTSRSAVFGDDQNVFVVEMSQEGKPAYTRVFRTYDGATVRAPDFRQAYEDRIRLVGRNILVADKDKEATTLRLYDPLTGKDVWKQAFAPKSVVMQADAGDLAGVIEPDGLVRVVDLATRKEVLTAASKMELKDVDKDTAFTLMGDATDVYVFPNAPMSPNSRMTSNLMPITGLRGVNVNGEVYAFRREAEEVHKADEIVKKEKGSVHWHKTLPNEQLVVDQFQDMPMLFMTASTTKFQAPFGGQVSQATTLKVLDKRTGKLLFDTDNYTGGPFYALEVDARNGKIQFTSPQERVSFTLANDGPATPPAKP